MSSDILCIHDLLMIIMQILALVFIIMCLISFNPSDSYYINDLIDNWSIGPIFSVTNQVTCPNDNTFIIGDTWPGTVTGCFSNGTLTVGECHKDSLNGVNVPAIDPIQYKAWRGRQLCGNRRNLTYFDLNIEANALNCTTGTRSCGVIDTFNNVLCLNTSLQCPLNYFNVVMKNTTLPTGFTYTAINTIDDTLIFSNFNTEGRILNQFKLSEGNPCLNPLYENYKHPRLPLDFYIGREQCDEDLYDNRYESIDSYPKYFVFRDNNIMDRILRIPGGNRYMSQMLNSKVLLNLYLRSYIGLSVACHNVIREMGIGDSLLNEMRKMDMNSKSAHYLSIYSVSFCAFGLTAFIIAGIVFMCVSDKERYINRLMISIIPSIAFAVSFCLNCVILERLHGIGSNYKLITDPGCTDETTFINVISNIQNLNYATIYSILALATSFVTAILPVLGSIYFCCTNTK